MNDEYENQLKEIEVSIEELRVHVRRREALNRLSQNSDFQQLVEQEYFINESSRMLLLRDDPNLPADKKKFLEADMYGPGAFKRYLSTIMVIGRIAEENIEQLQDTANEIHDDISETGDE